MSRPRPTRRPSLHELEARMKHYSAALPERKERWARRVLLQQKQHHKQRTGGSSSATVDGHGRPRPPFPVAGYAGVLVALYETVRRDGGGKEWSVMLTKRADTLNSHSGEVALPGGKSDPEDGGSVVVTALREAQEEVGLQPEQVRVLGEAMPIVSKHGLLVTPVVGVLRDESLRTRDFADLVNADEVAVVFGVPLRVFLSREFHSSKMIKWQGFDFPLHTFMVPVGSDGEFDPSGETVMRVWGMTASILVDTASILLERKPEFSMRRASGSSKL